MNRGAWLFVFLFLVLPSTVCALSVVGPNWQTYKFGENVTFVAQVFDETGAPLIAGVVCNVTLYNKSGAFLAQSGLSASGPFFVKVFDASVFSETGQFPYSLWCNGTAGAGFSQNNIFVTPTGRSLNGFSQDLTPVAVIIALPLILAFLLLLGAATLDAEEHPVLKIFLFLLSSIPFYISLWWGSEVVGRFYDFPELIEAMADGTFIFGLVLFVVLFYFVIYALYKMFQTMAQKKDERLRY